MTNEMQCPVCGLKNIAQDQENCPQCDADLTCYQVLEKIPDNIPTAATEKRRDKTDYLILGLVILLVCIVSGLTVIVLLQNSNQSSLSYSVASKLNSLTNSLDKIESKVSSLENSTATKSLTGLDRNQTYSKNVVRTYKLKDQNKTKLEQKGHGQGISQNQSLQTSSAKKEEKLGQGSEKKLKNINKTQNNLVSIENNEVFTYTCKDTDTVWELAEKFYNDGRLYPVILKYNPKVSIYEIKQGIKLKIIKDKKQALRLFKKILLKEHDKSYWKYTIQHGDTLSSVAAKYCQTKECKTQIQRVNADLKVTPGNTIKIPMH